ncbi:hypothetical protein FJZ33_09380, partial [Candidatus Poribacteria bacterium]|nr:hypothetical protein [Candidatus Poribacteria bacterium]
MYKQYKFYFAIASIVLLIAGCSTTKYLTVNEAYRISSERAIWVTTISGAEYKMDKPKVDGSKIVGTVYGEPKEINFSDIAFVKLKKRNKEQIVLGAAAGVTAIGMWYGSITAPPMEISCPFIYSFDGKEYVLDSNLLHGAGINEETDYARLTCVVPKDGKIQIKITNEMSETEYIDELKLLKVDHPAEVNIIPDMDGKIHTLKSQIEPSVAYESTGENILYLISKKDGQFWGYDRLYESLDEMRVNTIKELIFDFPKPKKTLILEFPKPKEAKIAKLVMNVCNTAYGINKAARFLRKYRDLDILLRFASFHGKDELFQFNVDLLENGKWRTKGHIHGASPVISRDQIAILDISKIQDEKVILRLPIADGFWMIDS